MNTNHLEQLRLQRDHIALEAFAGDVKALLFSTFPSMVKELVGYTDQFAPETPPVVVTSSQADFLKEIAKHPYLEICPLAAFVPEGLNATFYKYGAELLLATMHASRILTGGLTAYSTFLAQLVNNDQEKFSTFDHGRAYKALSEERTKLNSDMGKCFKNGSTKTEVSLGDVTDRNTDWQHVFAISDNMTKLINSVDRKALNKKVAECKDLLGIIIKKIENDQFNGMSPQAIKNLSDGAYQAACELEFYAVVYYKVVAYTTAVDRTVSHFKKVINKKD